MLNEYRWERQECCHPSLRMMSEDSAVKWWMHTLKEYRGDIVDSCFEEPSRECVIHKWLRFSHDFELLHILSRLETWRYKNGCLLPHQPEKYSFHFLKCPRCSTVHI
jgi:hypothetical protein